MLDLLMIIYRLIVGNWLFSVVKCYIYGFKISCYDYRFGSVNDGHCSLPKRCVYEMFSE